MDIKDTYETKTTVVRPEERQKSMEILTAGSVIEVVGGAGAVVLTILALSGIYPFNLGAISVIAVGAALLFAGGAVASRYSKIVNAVGRERTQEAELGGGTGAEFIGGAAGVVLGILALIDIAPITLMAISVIVFGGVFLLSSGTISTIEHFIEATRFERTGHLARNVVMSAAGVQALAGVGAAILGILALVGISPLTLCLVALLGLGASIVISGSALSGRLASALRH